MRIQAVHAIGQMFNAGSRSGHTIDPAERAACAALLRQYLGDDTPDQLFSVALRSLGKIADISRDAELYQVTTSALSSSSLVRREAALEALYQSDVSLDDTLVHLVRSMGESDPGQSVRVSATAVLEKHDVATMPPSP